MLHLRQADRRQMGRIRPKNQDRRKPQRCLRQLGNQKVLLQANDTFQRGDNRRNFALLRRGREKKRSPQPVLSLLLKARLIRAFSVETTFILLSSARIQTLYKGGGSAESTKAQLFFEAYSGVSNHA
jgi:hypothetical protein